MLRLNPPSLKKPLCYYMSIFAVEQKKHDCNFWEFLDETFEGAIIKKRMKKDEYNIDLEIFYDRIAKRITDEIKAEKKKRRNAIIEQVTKEQRKLGNYEYNDYSFYTVYNNHELVYQESRGEVMIDKGQESNLRIALKEKLGEKNDY